MEILDNDGDAADTRAPLLTRTTVNTATLVLTYDETVDGEEALAVDTAEELGRALLTGRYVVASDAVRAEYGLTGEGEKGQPRYFALKLPIAIDERTATFVYVDAGQSTDSELRAWGVAHAPLWAALRARTFAVHVVAVGAGVDAAARAALVLKRWTQDGDGQGAADPAGATKVDPDIRQEIARLEHAIRTGHRERLRAAGGFETAADRLSFLRKLPDGTPTTATARGAIDRGSIWPTVRLTTPEVAI